MKYYLLIFVIFVYSQMLSAQSPAGYALSLDGIDDYAWVPDDTALNPQNQITLEAWVYSENYNRSQWQEFVMKGGNNSQTPRQYYIRPINGEGRVQFVLHDAADDDDNTASSDDELINGSWYHIAGTYDGQFMRVYINGILQDEDDTFKITISFMVSRSLR